MQTNRNLVGACGCVHHADGTWGLCADCSARIGKFGTCLACGGAADEWWVVDEDPSLGGCSPECAQREYADSQS